MGRIDFCDQFRKSKSMQGSGTDTITTQIKPSKLKREITNITNSQNTKRTYGQPSEQLFPKRWPLSNRNRINREQQQNYRLGTGSNELLGGA